MTPADILDSLVKANLASGAAILAVLALRKPVRSRFGARLAYGLWLLPLLAGAAVLLPARQVVVVQPAAPMLSAAVRIGHVLEAPSAAALAAGPRLHGPALLVALWLAGVVGAALVMAVLQQRFIARARRGGVGPAVVGLVAPRILPPADFAERYNPAEQALVLAHEQAHLARHDSRLNGLAAALQCLNWFNPLVHIAARLMRIDQELACDEAVANRFPEARRAYAEVLMKAQLAVLPLPLGCYWPARSQHPLVERVAMLKRPRVGRGRWRAGAIALGCLWAGAGLAAWASQPAEVRTVIKTAPAAPSSGKPAADAAPAVPATLADSPPKPVGSNEAPLINRLKIEGNALFTDVRLRMMVQEQPETPLAGATMRSDADAIVKLYRETGWPDAKVTYKVSDLPRNRVNLTLIVNEGAKAKPGDFPIGLISFSARQVIPEEDRHRVIYKGDVETVQRGRRVLSDLLVLTSRAPGEPGGPDLIKEAMWEGDVRVEIGNFGDQAATADRAVYDGGAKTMTLSGHVVVQRGPWVVENDKLVIPMKDQ